MQTESVVVIRARKALKEETDIDIRVPDYVKSIRFVFTDGVESDSFVSWFSECRSRQIKDIKMDMDGRIVCFWDRKATCFVCNTAWDQDRCSMEFCEKDFYDDISELYVVNNVDDYKKTLQGLSALANKIGYPNYALRFETAYKILAGETKPDHVEAPYYIQELPDKLKDIMLARNISYVFGGMGSWDDDPKGAAEEKELGNEYERLTNNLKRDLLKSLVFVSNES